MPYHLADTAWSPRRVLGKRTAHCLEGAIFAAAALRVLSRPVNLARFDRTHAGWMTSADDLWFIPMHLVGIPHTRLVTRAMARRLSRVDRRSLAAGLVGYREH